MSDPYSSLLALEMQPPSSATEEHEPSEASMASNSTFPVQLHFLLSEFEEEHQGIVSWSPHGRSFIVHKTDQFVERVLKRWFRQNKYTSFQRQLNIYGFKRITAGPDKNACYHPKFVRGDPMLARQILRSTAKGTGPRRPHAPAAEPNFYILPFRPPNRPAATSARPGNEVASQPASLHASAQGGINQYSGMSFGDPSSMTGASALHGALQGNFGSLSRSNGTLPAGLLLPSHQSASLGPFASFGRSSMPQPSLRPTMVQPSLQLLTSPLAPLPNNNASIRDMALGVAERVSNIPLEHLSPGTRDSLIRELNLHRQLLALQCATAGSSSTATASHQDLCLSMAGASVPGSFLSGSGGALANPMSSQTNRDDSTIRQLLQFQAQRNQNVFGHGGSYDPNAVLAAFLTRHGSANR